MRGVGNFNKWPPTLSFLSRIFVLYQQHSPLPHLELFTSWTGHDKWRVSDIPTKQAELIQ